MRRRRPPVRRHGDGFVVELERDESELVVRLLGELGDLLTDEQPAEEQARLLQRLFPVAHPDDDEAEAEYQRFMRDDLVQSRLSAIAAVEAALGESGGRERSFDEAGLTAFMQSINAIRLVLGTLLGVSDDPNIGEVDQAVEKSPEYNLYAYLSWLLENSVQAISAG